MEIQVSDLPASPSSPSFAQKALGFLSIDFFKSIYRAERGAFAFKKEKPMTMAVRKVITRSKKTFRVKYPSQKNKRTIRCESLLERDTALLLEISPHVRSFREQPSVEIYYDDKAEPRSYTPDFEVILQDESIVHIEVKPLRHLKNPQTKSKLEAIARRYEELGRRFRIFTEADVRCEPLQSNLKLLAYHSRRVIDDALLTSMQQRLHCAHFRTVADAAKVVGGEKYVYRLIASGFLRTDFDSPIGIGSHIWISNSEGDNDSLRV